ncbi:protein-tyrosine phosphatase family protein [Arthrobacter glacialis]|uniref:Protein phosphatase n=1 Tax=Arthrobacter glacialis TaxID=1664 RepID=A0A2S3ZTT6_ARTGL|nr:protein-tyrosine phosphatase family protein [Arthrobacter glacialis]POH57251.1 protein phosphatase [Arthrobacter glacialis]POH72392.1 protein phosphatase [Arthrobacter glacialis]
MNTWSDQASVVEFPDGRRIRGASLRESRRTTEHSDFTVYLLGRAPSHPLGDYHWVKWRDFGVPASSADAVGTLQEAFERSTGERVEIVCRGGVGRTGTALALLAMMAGIAGTDAMDWVREHYHPHAVETPGQRRWLRQVATLL